MCAGTRCGYILLRSTKTLVRNVGTHSNPLCSGLVFSIGFFGIGSLRLRTPGAWVPVPLSEIIRPFGLAGVHE